MAPLDHRPLTSRHLAVIGILQLASRRVSARAIARRAGFEVAEVLLLLEDIIALDGGAHG